ncbi:MAG TPA: rhodanese-like domain-containing protein [Chitinophagaceae bacterium]|nr:rhodanese-like domain-containing protein [Chitinophagaceae bacterium]
MPKQISILLFSFFTITLTAYSQNTYHEITLPGLMKKKQSGDNNMVIVDVRTKGEYGDTSRNKASNIGHIKGAINVTLQDLQQNPDAVKQLEPFKEKDIYLICSHSYRSRSASNILLKNGFTHVSNVQGGMTEWYRRYDELASYRAAFLEKGITHNNISPEELLDQLTSEKKVLLFGIRNSPRAWFDSFNIKLYRYYPIFKNTVYFNYADSMKILEAAQKAKQPVVFFNLVNNGAAELAEWLTQKAVPDVSYLVGGTNLFYEYALNKQTPEKTEKLFTEQSLIRFITPVIYCQRTSNKNMQLVDIRHDTLFNKVNSGVKHDYKHLKNAINFFAGKGASLFEQEFPDKKKEYVFIADNVNDIALADELTKKGYKISWMTGGLDRWEWYMNNVEDFKCNDLLSD